MLLILVNGFHIKPTYNEAKQKSFVFLESTEDTLPTETPEDEINMNKTNEPIVEITPLPEEDSSGTETPSTPLENNSISKSANNESKIAGSFSEFKSALEDSTTTTIYLNTDINIPYGGITINPAKPSLIIDGTSPDDGITHTITDYYSADYTNTISLEANSVLKSITIKNIILHGKNYYGTVCIYSTVSNVTVTYENIRYYGPQLTYNIYGTAHYKNCYIEIGRFGGACTPSELAEAKNVIFEGNTKVTQVESTTYEIIHSIQPGTIEFVPDSNVIIKTYSDGGFFFGTSSTNLIVHERADFQFYGPTRFWELIPFKNVTVRPNARLYIEITSSLLYNALLRVDGSLTVELDSELILINRGSSLFWTINMNGGNAIFRNPKRVVFYNPGIRALYYGIQGELSINAQQIRYWTTASALSSAGKFEDIPTYHWNKKDNSNLEANGTIIAGALGTFTSLKTNYNSDNTIGGILDKTTFHLPNARVLALGRLPLTAEYVPLSETTSKIIGLTEPEANIRILFADDSNSEIKLTAKADINGTYEIPLNFRIKDGTVISVKSNKLFLFSEIDTIANNSLFQFHISSKNIEFQTTYLSHEPQLVRRNDPNWDVVIADGRGSGSTWSLSVMLTEPLSYIDEHNSAKYTLDNALVYIDEAGHINTLTTDSEIPICSHTTASEMDVTTIRWEDDKGILALIKPRTAYINLPYKGSILWILKNTP